MGPERLSGWGRYPVVTCEVSERPDAAQVTRDIAGFGSMIARGNGRSYGDSSLNDQGVVSTRRLDRMLHFSSDGEMTCEAGTLLSDIIDTLLPRGWFPMVTPGTQFVTIGGMIASDVHGKNHHGVGSFADHLLSFDLALGNGEVVTCSRSENTELFAATCGGMGLTGVILRATFKLAAIETSRIRQRAVRAATLDEAIAVFEGAGEVSYSVAWIDCLARGRQLGRSVVFLGEHARLEELPAESRSSPFARPHRMKKRAPFDLPSVVLSRPSVRVFNAMYFHVPRAEDALVDISPYFYPLDTIEDWNRIYGRPGFVQYQVALPLAESRQGLHRLLEEIAAAGRASFLAVLKRLGPQSFGLLSFPLPGYTLALDFPATPETFALLERLDAIVREHRGRIYLTKDARMSPATMEAGYPRLSEFRRVRETYGLRERFSSLQSRRLDL